MTAAALARYRLRPVPWGWLAVLAAGRTSVLGGGAAAMAAVVALSTAGRAWPTWFPIQLDSVPGDRHWQSSRAWMIGLGLVLVAAALATEGRTGTRLGVSRRQRGPARPGQAAKVRAGP